MFFSRLMFVFFSFTCSHFLLASENVNSFVSTVEARSENGLRPVIGNVFSQNVQGYFLGHDSAGCSAVSIVYSPSRVDHYRVCNGAVIPRNSVAPLYPMDDKQAVEALKMHVAQARAYGKSLGSWFDYSIRATRLGNNQCSMIELVITFDNDLVAVSKRSLCGT